MFRICITLIAYIISYVSHSNEFPNIEQNTDQLSELKVIQVGYKATNKTGTEENLILTDLN